MRLVVPRRACGFRTVFRNASGAESGLPEQIFQMRIHAAEFVLRPPFQNFIQLRIDAQRKILFRWHTAPLINRTAVDDRLGGTVGDDCDHQIVDHRRFPLFIQLQTVFLQLGDRHLYHADGAFDNHLPG